ncbi:MAG: FtsX-like permease family protein [Alphaproteobacteria bacterium]|nr:FtsX-like permease family protein [Alphaproteobacteria bacterium]
MSEAAVRSNSTARAWLRIARRELAGGVGGFWIYLACLALGAWAIAASGSVTTAFNAGLTGQSHMLLGGDAALNLSQREATPEELAWMAKRALPGKISQTAGVDMMGREGDIIRQVDVRGVDHAFPLLGAIGLATGSPGVADALAKRDGVWGILASPKFVSDFKVKPGDRITLGDKTVEVRAFLASEPDRLSNANEFQPRALISTDALREWGQLDQGRLYRTTYRLLLKPGEAPHFEADVNAAWGEAGMRYVGPQDAVDGLRRLLDMMNTFTSVIGIAALVAGGVGVSQATTSFLDSRVESIAALKALGADAGTIRAAYALQLGALAALGSAVGVALGSLSPWLLDLTVGDRIPLPSVLAFYPLPLLKAFVLGLLAAVMFASPALGRARATPPAALFRSLGENMGKAPWVERVVAMLAGLGLVLVATLGSERPWMVIGLLAGAGVAWGVLMGAALLIKRLARSASRRSRGYVRLALASLGGPGSLAPTVAPALGLGLSLLTLVAVIQTNVLGQIRDTAPANAPSLIFRQIPHEDVKEFDALMKSMGVDTANPDVYRRAPFILGRVISLKGQTLTENNVADSERWVTRGETGMTFIGPKPPEADVRSGKWWPADYSGPLLVSVEEGVAKGLDLKVGDTMGFRIFGRDLDARVASIRRVDWGGFGANMPFILSPGTLEAAKPFHTAILKVPPDREDPIIAKVADGWPGVLVFPLRRTLETAADLLDQISLVVIVLASVVTLAGILVLFGAFAAAARKRRRESALLKTFGASRPAILALYAFEFALAGLAAAILGAGMGVLAAHPIVINVIEAKWRFAFGPVLTVASIAVISAAAGGVAVGWATLSHRPARVLRSA